MFLFHTLCYCVCIFLSLFTVFRRAFFFFSFLFILEWSKLLIDQLLTSWMFTQQHVFADAREKTPLSHVNFWVPPGEDISGIASPSLRVIKISHYVAVTLSQDLHCPESFQSNRHWICFSEHASNFRYIPVHRCDWGHHSRGLSQGPFHAVAIPVQLADHRHMCYRTPDSSSLLENWVIVFPIIH